MDLESGVWTKLRIEVSWTIHRLFVYGQAQPTLIVNDPKLGVGKGGIALWIAAYERIFPDSGSKVMRALFR